MPADRRIFSELDTDTAPETVPNGKAAAMRNIQPERGYNWTVRGNRLVAATLPDGTNTAVGWAELPDGDGVVWLNYNSAGNHSLLRYRPAVDATAVVLLVWSGLRLPAPGTRPVPVAVLGDFLLYLDADGEARNIPMGRCASGYYTPELLAAEPLCLHLAKVVPQTAPTTERVVEALGFRRPLLLEGHVFQFAVRWRYADGEVTVFSPPSLPDEAAYLPGKDRRTAILVMLPDTPPALVREVEVLVSRDAELVWVVAERLTRRDDGTFAGAILFTGTTTGEAVAAPEATRTFEALWPARALAVARNRVWAGNLREGYPTPQIAVAAQAVQVEPVSELRNIQRVEYTTRTGSNNISFLRYYASVGNQYEEVARVATYDFVNYDESRFIRINQTLLTPADFAAPLANQTGRIVQQLGLRPVFDMTGPTLHGGYVARVSLQFYDIWGRPFGVGPVTEVPVPVRTPSALAPRTRLAWQLPEDAIIPEGAAFYSILAASATPLTFVQGIYTNAISFQGRRPDDTPIVGAVDVAHKRLWLELGSWPAVAGQGYVWQAGSNDQLRLPAAGLILPITGQYGDWLEVEYNGVIPEIGLIEIFTPSTSTAISELLYERTPRYPVVVTEGVRGFSTLQGELDGDAFLSASAFIGRGGFETNLVEQKLPTAEFRTYAPTYVVIEAPVPGGRKDGPRVGFDRGRLGAVLPEALQVTQGRGSIRFSGVRLAGTQLNGLATWEPLNQRSLPSEAGAVQVLAVADDVQSQTSVLLAVCHTGTVSLGLGVSRVRQADGGAIVAEADSVIGYTDTLRGGFGTQHPESVTARDGRIWFWDARHQTVCRYAQDGVNPLNWQKQARTLGRELAAYDIGRVRGGFDPQTREYVLAFSGTPSRLGSSISTRLDGLEDQAVASKPVLPARTERFSELRDAFVGGVDFVPEAMVGTTSTFYTLRGGQLWEHTDEVPRLTWYGTKYPAFASFWCNEAHPYSKTWQALVQEGGPVLWELTEARTPTGQLTRLPAVHMEWLEDKWYGALLNDETSPGFAGPDAAVRARYEGVPVQGTVLRCTVRCTDTTPAARLVATTLTYVLNSGQTAPA